MQFRKIVFAAALAAFGCHAGFTCCGALAQAQTQDWPTSAAVRVVVPFAAGGPVDVPARLMNERLSAQTKGTFIVENRGGAGGAIGAQQVAQAAPDGQMLLFTTSSISIAPALYPNLPFDPLELTMISLIAEVPIVLAVRGDSPIKTLAELIAKAKAEPGKITFGSGGVGTGNHLSGELLKTLAGINLLHVPYRGMAPGMTALYAGDIDSVFSSTIEALQPARDGRLRVLGICSPERLTELPDVPSIAELVPGYAMANWYGLFGPNGLPPAIVQRLERELAAMRSHPLMVERAATAGIKLKLTSADVLRERMAAEVPRWKKIAGELKLKPD
jgi:tripartite-type tricarboxylate transporter receptor subunit TctC